MEAEPDTKWVDRGLNSLYLDIEYYRRTAAACVDIRYTISTSTPSPSTRYTIRLGSTLPKYSEYTLLECTWYLVSLVEAEPDTKWVDRGLITSRHRMLSSNGCCARRYTIHHQYIAKYTIRLGSTLPPKCIPYLNVPGISWKRSPTRNGLTVADYISTTTNVIVARLLCAYSRDSIVWLSCAHDLGQAALR